MALVNIPCESMKLFVAAIDIRVYIMILKYSNLIASVYVDVYSY